MYDGAWTRHIGTDGGTTLSWADRVGLVGGCTLTIYRLPDVDPNVQARQALRHASDERAMRAELAAAAAGALEPAFRLTLLGGSQLGAEAAT